LVRFNGAGQIIGTTPLGLLNPVQEFGSWVGNSPAGLSADAGTFDDATRWDATLAKVFWSAKEPYGFASRQRNLQMRNPGRGIFAKSHAVTAAMTFQHISIRIAPTFQDYWKNLLPSYPVHQDQYGNYFMTIGAGTADGDTSIFCTGTLIKGINRDKDVTVPPIKLEKLPVGTLDEIRLTNDLIAYYNNYQDDLPYACVPEANVGKYNSNSFASGLLLRSGAPLPLFPIRGTLAPGWSTPVPPWKFDRQ
jgi:hypothetical protein